MVKFYRSDKVWTVLLKYLCETVLIWYSVKLSKIKKDLLYDINLNNWFGAMIYKFKKWMLLTLQHL